MKKTNIKKQIKEYFFINPTSRLRVREIERALNLPLPSVINYCKELVKEGILKTLKTGKVVFYTANRINEKFLLEKKFFNIKQLHEEGILQYLKTEYHNPLIIVFGSYAKGEDIENSDIDLYIETSSKKNIDTENFEKSLKRKIQIFKYPSMKKIENHNLANNIVNGIILNGFIEAFK